MSLMLRVTHYRGQPLQRDTHVIFEDDGGTLGRAVHNHLILDDPSHAIAPVQSRIDRRADYYYLTDNGGCPSLFNNRPLEQGRAMVLHDGDCLAVGDYRMEVVIQVTVKSMPRRTGVVTAAPSSAEVTPLQQYAGPSLSASVSGPYEQYEPGKGLPDELARSSILDDGGLHDSELLLVDPLGYNLFSRLLEQALPSLEEHLSPVFRGPESDHLSPERQALSMPTSDPIGAPVYAEPVKLIPMNYDPLTDSVRSPRSVVDARVRPHNALPEKNSQTTPAAFSVTEDATYHALLAGLGLPGLRTHHSPLEMAHLVGAMLLEATQGAMALLPQKGASHNDATIIQQGLINPLRCFADAGSALSAMFSEQSSTYLAPIATYEATFVELNTHHQNAVAGMSETLKNVTRCLDPARIERLAEAPDILDKLLPSRRKARLWNRLVEFYSTYDVDNEAQALLERSLQSRLKDH